MMICVAAHSVKNRSIFQKNKPILRGNNRRAAACCLEIIKTDKFASDFTDSGNRTKDNS